MFKPLGDRILVRFDVKEEMTASGFVLAGTSKETTKTATVVAIGQGVRTLNGDLIKPSVAVGDTILVEAGLGIDVKDGDDVLTIIRESDILAVITE